MPSICLCFWCHQNMETAMNLLMNCLCWSEKKRVHQWWFSCGMCISISFYKMVFLQRHPIDCHLSCSPHLSFFVSLSLSLSLSLLKIEFLSCSGLQKEGGNKGQKFLVSGVIGAKWRLSRMNCFVSPLCTRRSALLAQLLEFITCHSETSSNKHWN